MPKSRKCFAFRTAKKKSLNALEKLYFGHVTDGNRYSILGIFFTLDEQGKVASCINWSLKVKESIICEQAYWLLHYQEIEFHHGYVIV